MNDLGQYGISGIAIAGLSWFIMYLLKQHKEERADWKKTTEKQFEDSNRMINENTGIVSELSTLIKTIKK